MRLGGTVFDGWVAVVTVLVGAGAVLLAYALRGVLVKAPGTAFPLLFTVTLGGVLLVVWVSKLRRDTGSEGEGEED